MLVGSVLILLTVALPPGATGSDMTILCLGAVTGAIGIGLLVAGDAPEWVLGLCVAVGTAVITLATAEGGLSGTGAEDNEILYVWICIYSFYFMRLPHALAQLALVGVAYGLLLSLDAPSQTVATRWLTTMTTLLLAGLLIARLRSSLESSFEELSRRAGRDPLTGAMNRRALEERTARGVPGRRRTDEPLSVIVADLDNLKELNDALGHSAGDDALRITAEVLRAAVRDTDTVARTGGDEFVVLLPGTSAHQARAIAERLHSAAQSRLAAFGDTGLSVGVAGDEGAAGKSFATLWREADELMYEAKRAGGDRVGTGALEPPPVPEPV